MDPQQIPTGTCSTQSVKLICILLQHEKFLVLRTCDYAEKHVITLKTCDYAEACNYVEKHVITLKTSDYAENM